MEDKYYTPELEDFRIGYVYEENHSSWTDGKITEKWLLKTFREPLMYGDTLSFKLKSGQIRVPYLTQKDIEGEGWEYDVNFEAPDWDYEELGFLKEMSDNRTQYMLYYNPNKHSIRIEKIYECGVEGWIFKGKCLSINELKLIEKLIGIK